MADNIIELKDVKLQYNKDYCALFDINLEVNKGDRIAIIGETGSGKTALLRLIAGLEKQKSGECYIKGTPINKINFSRDVSLGYLSTKAVFFERKSVYKNLLWTLKVHKVDKKEREERIDAILEEFGIQNLKKERVGTLCNSDRRLVQIARMAMRPLEIILCDDVLTIDDTVTQEKIKKALRNLFDSAPKDKVVIMASQDESLCKDFVNKIIYIQSGSFVDNEKVFIKADQNDEIKKSKKSNKREEVKAEETIANLENTEDEPILGAEKSTANTDTEANEGAKNE